MGFLEGVSPENLLTTQDPELSAELFRRSVTMVEIEVFSYCNRRCWFCPNAHIDRISQNTHMRPEIYTSILSQLASIEYQGRISYSRYNEPLADKIILERLRQAGAILPRALLHTNTNGDYLTPEYLEELYDAGLRSMNVQIYLKNHERYDHDRIDERGEQTVRRLELPYQVTVDQPGVWYEMQIEYRNMKIRLYGRNFAVNGTSRGDQVDIHRDYVRTLPCATPFWSVYIDYNGKMVPCCNYRSDVPDHASYILSEHPDLFATYASAKATSFRRSMLTLEPKTGPCANCRFALEEMTPARIDRMNALLDS
jgi:hypothetical protein